MVLWIIPPIVRAYFLKIQRSIILKIFYRLLNCNGGNQKFNKREVINATAKETALLTLEFQKVLPLKRAVKQKTADNVNIGRLRITNDIQFETRIAFQIWLFSPHPIKDLVRALYYCS